MGLQCRVISNREKSVIIYLTEFKMSILIIKNSNLFCQFTQSSVCVNNRAIDKIRSVKSVWQFQVIKWLNAHCIVFVVYTRDRVISIKKKSLVLIEMRVIVEWRHYQFLLIQRKLVFVATKYSLRSLWKSLVMCFRISRGSHESFGMRLKLVIPYRWLENCIGMNVLSRILLINMLKIRCAMII